MKRKRILLMDLGRVKGGVESYLERLAAALERDVDFYCICILPELARELGAKGVRVTLLPGFGGWGKLFGFLVTLFLLPFTVLTKGIDAVQVNGLLEGIFLPLTRLLGREAIYTRHGPFEEDLYVWYRQPLRYLPRYLSRFCARFATRVICVSEDTKQTVLGIVPEERISVIQNWAPYLPPYRTPAPAENRPVRLLCVARLEEYKGIQMVVDAMTTLTDGELTVVGDGNYGEKLREMAAGRKVFFAGYKEDPAPFYAEADIYIMPSLGPEGSCMGALEAMAYSLPCLLSDLPVYKELTSAGGAAMHFRCGDAAHLREQLALLMHDHGLRETLSREGYEMVKKHYTPEVARSQYLVAFGVFSTTTGTRA